MAFVFDEGVAAVAAADARGLYRRGAKRALDLALVLILAVPAGLLVAGLCLAARRDGGPGLFAHERVGRDGRRFRCWKIRTMVPDARAALAAHLARDPAAAEEWARTHKLADDPRITPLGRLLRRASLDELPQLWNILRGEMSFVGPRPVTDAELGRYGGHDWAYLALRPGLTGLWQVSGRHQVSYAQRVAMDVAYAGRCSLGADLRILWLTLGVVRRGTGC